MNKSCSVLCFTGKTILPKLLVPSFRQIKPKTMRLQGNTPCYSYSEDQWINFNNLRATLSYSISDAKNSPEIVHEAPVQNYLKKIQKTGELIHCFDPKTHKQVDVPIRIFRTHFGVTFLPSENFLQKKYSNEKLGQHQYNPVKDAVLSTYKFTCKNCGHHEARTFPENGLKFGTVLTGCEHCKEVELVADHLGWIQKGKQKLSKDLMFDHKIIHSLIRKQLKKVGINPKDDQQ